MNKQILKIKEYIEKHGWIIYRNHGIAKEVISFATTLDSKDFNEYRDKEYNEYYNMIKNQIEIVRKEYKKNLYSRRLLFQFDRFYYENKLEDYLICPESFSIFFISESLYSLVINMRSSDVNRLEEDISIIKAITKKIFEKKYLLSIKLHCHNIHIYGDYDE